MKRLIKASFLFLLIFLISAIPSAPGMAGEDEIARQSTADSQGDNQGYNPGMWLVSFFRKHISPVDGSKCPSIPSCSSYSVKAIKKHGFFTGWMMTVDRLIHEGEAETTVSPLVFSEGGWKIYDPVENNDFWWHPQDRTPHE